MVLRLAASLALLPVMLAGVAFAQVRTPPIPADSYRAVIRHLGSMAVAVDGNLVQLAPGAQIRDQQNLIIVPMSIPPDGAWADFIVNADGQVYRVWLLTPDELAVPKPRVGGG
jgi:hypothetical protein